jgi:hypothetical protein
MNIILGVIVGVVVVVVLLLVFFEYRIRQPDFLVLGMSPMVASAFGKV